MRKLAIAEEFDIAIKLAAKDSDEPSRQIAERFYLAEPAFVEALSKEWAIEKLTALIRQRRSTENRHKDLQYQLVGFRPPRSYALADGTRVAWSSSTLKELKRGRSAVWKQHKDYKHPAVQRFDKAIEFMEAHASKQARITWQEAIGRTQPPR